MSLASSKPFKLSQHLAVISSPGAFNLNTRRDANVAERESCTNHTVTSSRGRCEEGRQKTAVRAPAAGAPPQIGCPP